MTVLVLSFLFETFSISITLYRSVAVPAAVTGPLWSAGSISASVWAGEPRDPAGGETRDREWGEPQACAWGQQQDVPVGADSPGHLGDQSVTS